MMVSRTTAMQTLSQFKPFYTIYVLLRKASTRKFFVLRSLENPFLFYPIYPQDPKGGSKMTPVADFLILFFSCVFLEMGLLCKFLN